MPGLIHYDYKQLLCQRYTSLEPYRIELLKEDFYEWWAYEWADVDGWQADFAGYVPKDIQGGVISLSSTPPLLAITYPVQTWTVTGGSPGSVVSGWVIRNTASDLLVAMYKFDTPIPMDTTGNELPLTPVVHLGQFSQVAS